MTNAKALTPQEAIIRFKSEVQEKVLEVWNSLIVRNLKLQSGKASSEFTYKELVSELSSKANISHKEAKDRGWLDLEDIFRDKGWKVECDIPGYNESYDTKYKFKQ